MEPLKIMLIVLAAAGVWAVVELALTLRKARTTLDEVSHSATEAIDQATPIIAKLDETSDEAQRNDLYRQAQEILAREAEDRHLRQRNPKPAVCCSSHFTLPCLFQHFLHHASVFWTLIIL